VAEDVAGVGDGAILKIPLTLEELKIFYRQKAKELGMKQVEK